MDPITFGVLGPVVAWDGAGGVLGLKGPRHRAVLARLIMARRRVVPVARLVEDLWDEPAPGAVGAVQTFVAALRRVLEPHRPARAPARLLVTEGPGYALRAAPDAVDAWRFEAAVAGAARLPAGQALEQLGEALELWRGPAYAEFAEEDWARGECSRLAELRLQAVERQARARLDLGLAAEAVPDLDAHLAEHPWREDAWQLLGLALYRTGRQADALAVLRRARAMLADRLGVDPGPKMRRLEADILTHDPRLDLRAEPSTAVTRLWTRTAAAYDRTVAADARARLESTVGLIRDLALTGGPGLRAAREHRLQAVTAAEEFGDPDLTARVIGAYDVPAIWTRDDDPEQARQIVAAAERALAALPRGGAHEAARCRLLSTIALEMRGTRSPRGPQAASEAEEIARRLDDPTLLAFALNAAFMQSCTRAGLSPRRDAIGEELVALAARHGLVTFEVLGHLIRMQARSALGDFPAADVHAAAADRLAERHERPLVSVFTSWYRALRWAARGRIPQAGAAYRDAAARLDGAGMPGVEHGLLPLAQLCLRMAGGSTSAGQAAEHVDADADWGPYRPWVEPFILLRSGRRADAEASLRALPEPPADLLYEAMCCLQAAAALELGDRAVLEQLHARLRPAAGELAGAGSGMLTLGPVDRWLSAITNALHAATGSGRHPATKP
ncbi:BTAD domain-containing putative transcriptional regulator [Streptomyces sp. NPDC093984]|uniref:BTAD domain-containing putative transcriptional regulator n=1 Tax=Streptomyces sp. NPDC093984 TaxID=3366052 RepID=UPI0037F9B424